MDELKFTINASKLADKSTIVTVRLPKTLLHDLAAAAERVRRFQND